MFGTCYNCNMPLVGDVLKRTPWIDSANIERADVHPTRHKGLRKPAVSTTDVENKCCLTRNPPNNNLAQAAFIVRGCRVAFFPIVELFGVTLVVLCKVALYRVERRWKQNRDFSTIKFNWLPLVCNESVGVAPLQWLPRIGMHQVRA
jgi:hypothetical protein